MTLTYAEALNYLYAFINYEHKTAYPYSAETFDLSRVTAFFAALGDPHTRFRSIHIAGTKGKGSVAAMCESVLRTAGYRVGLYTSPHLQDFRERIQIDRELIPEDDFAAVVDAIRPAIDRQPGLTWFEIVTGLACAYFAQRQVDIAVLEVGLGGRLDATNVVTPLVSALTSISYDHMHLLGNTLAEIAAEKAGIIKPGVPAVSAPQPPEAEAVFRRVAAERGAPLRFVPECFDLELREMTPAGQCFTLRPLQPDVLSPDRHTGLAAGPSDWRLPLTGEHQAVNAAVALLALDAVAPAGFAVDGEALHTGLATVAWAGRFDVICHAPTLVLDAAHNVDSAQKLARTIAALYPDRPLTLIFGASADKDTPGMLRELVPHARRVVLTRAANVRAADPEVLAEQVARLGVAPEITGDAGEALDRALAEAGEDALIVATGSIFVVGAVLDAWQRRRPA